MVFLQRYVLEKPVQFIFKEIGQFVFRSRFSFTLLATVASYEPVAVIKYIDCEQAIVLASLASLLWELSTLKSPKRSDERIVECSPSPYNSQERPELLRRHP